MTTGGIDFLKKLRHGSENQGLSRLLGLELEEVVPGYARVSLTCREEFTNILGMVHGTALFALVDEAFQVAANSHGSVAVALSMSLNFHQAPELGERLTAEARELHAGRRTATYLIQVTDPTGRLIASCQALAYRKGKPVEI